jgi:hypothetical protein
MANSSSSAPSVPAGAVRNRASPPFGDVLAECAPYMLVRNKTRYLFDVVYANQVNFAFGTSKHNNLTSIRHRSWQQTRYFKEFITSSGIPSYLVNDFLIQDMVDNDSYIASMKKRHIDGKTRYGMHAHKVSTSTVTYFEHESRPQLVYAFGPNLNDLVVRPASSCVFDSSKHQQVSTIDGRRAKN